VLDDLAKHYLHDYLRHVPEAMLAKVNGLSEYDARRPLPEMCHIDQSTGSTVWRLSEL
jgi:hypothetical protein